MSEAEFLEEKQFSTNLVGIQLRDFTVIMIDGAKTDAETRRRSDLAPRHRVTASPRQILEDQVEDLVGDHELGCLRQLRFGPIATDDQDFILI